MEQPQVVIASNRGPVAFVRDEHGDIVPRRGSGGLVTALTGAIQRSGGLWVATAMSEEDREQTAAGRLEVAAGEDKYHLRYLAFDPQLYDRYYNGISNRVLWFVHHYLWNVPQLPRFTRETRRDWDAFKQINRSFAAALAEEARELPGPTAYLIQDYHLSLVPSMLREREPGARIAHFSHVPFAGPGYLRILPTEIREELLAGLLGADVLGFQARAWAESFLLSCRELSEAKVDLHRRVVRWRGRTVRTRVYPISIDTEALEKIASTEEVARARRRLARWRGDAKLLLRVDRAELSKNILRGFESYELFLQQHPEWRRRVKFLALLNPSRRAIPEYRAYTRACLRVADRINDELGDDDWQPVEVHVRDHYPSVLAAYSLYDVLMVNPVLDGMNLVAKEGPALNRRHGVLILSETAGAHQELGRYALGVNPFDLEGMAEALARAIEMDPSERASRARGLRQAVLRNRPEDWVNAQLADLGD